MENTAYNKKIKSRIAIVGAGSAGLTAAQKLKQKGYKNITIFEKNDYVGGKCSTAEIEGCLYELGAGIVSENNHVVRDLIRQFHVPLKRVKFGKSLLVDSRTGQQLPSKSFFQQIRLLKQALITYKRLTRKYRFVEEPGFAKLDPELALPFSEFAQKHGIELLAKELEIYFTGFGYGYFCEIPAAYVLKYYCWGTVMAFLRRKIHFFPEGIQHLWTAVAEDHDVRFSTIINSIERGSVVTINTDRGVYEFDVLIIASPLDDALGYLQSSSKETELFSKIKYVDYRTVACSVSGLQKKSGYFPNNFSRSAINFPVFWHYRHASSNIYTFYTIADWTISDNEAVRKIKEIVSRMGGEMEKVHTVERWKYFPHVDSEVMKNGYFDDVESIQGENSTYYAGELMNFSTVGLTSEYAADLVKRFF